MQGLTKQNTMGITCKTCSKFIQVRTSLSNLTFRCPPFEFLSHPIFTLFNNQQKVLKCALPVTVPDGDTPIQAYFGAIEACLATPADRVTWALCNPNAGSATRTTSSRTLSHRRSSPWASSRRYVRASQMLGCFSPRMIHAIFRSCSRRFTNMHPRYILNPAHRPATPSRPARAPRAPRTPPSSRAPSWTALIAKQPKRR